MDRRSMLRGGRRDPGPTAKAFSREDVLFQRLYINSSDEAFFGPVDGDNRTSHASIAEHGGGESKRLTMVLNSENADYTSINVSGWTEGVAGPLSVFNSVGCSWLIYDIFGNPVYPNSPVMFQWAVELTDHKPTAGDIPNTSGDAIKSWVTIGVTDRALASVDSNTVFTSAGYYFTASGGDPKLLLGVGSTANMAHKGLDEVRKFFVGTTVCGPKTSTSNCYLGPVIGSSYSVADAGSGDGANTEAGQAITAFKSYQQDPANNPSWVEANQLRWTLAVGRQTQSVASDTDVEHRFRLWARAIPFCFTSDGIRDIRLLGKTW